jgi:membrane protease YdiL (CAAX protease family)
LWAFGVICPVLALGIVSVFLHRAVVGAPPAAIAHPTLELLAKHPTDPWSLALIAGAVLGAPLAEEIVFRAGVQTAVLRAAGSRPLAIALATVVFLAVHLGLPAHTLLPLGGLSIGLGLAYERTRSLVVPVVIHAGYNALNVAMVVWG